MNEAVPISYPTLAMPATELRAGMTLVWEGQRLLVERIERNPRRVVVHGARRTIGLDLDDEVEVRAAGRHPHYTQVVVAV
jgi:hypothetical protein